VHAENLLVNDSGTREAVEAIREGLPKFDAESSFTLIVKSIDTVDRSTFMIAAENEKVLRVLDFVGQKETNRFKRLFSTINVVPKEDII
jgi:hypothetical protein